MKYTKKYQFTKPEGKDKYNIDDQNENWERLEDVLLREQKRTTVLLVMQFLFAGTITWILKKELIYQLLKLSVRVFQSLQNILKKLK